MNAEKVFSCYLYFLKITMKSPSKKWKHMFSFAKKEEKKTGLIPIPKLLHVQRNLYNH